MSRRAFDSEAASQLAHLCRPLTIRSTERGTDKVPISNISVHVGQRGRYALLEGNTIWNMLGL